MSWQDDIINLLQDIKSILLKKSLLELKNIAVTNYLDKDNNTCYAFTEKSMKRYLLGKGK